VYITGAPEGISYSVFTEKLSYSRWQKRLARQKLHVN